MTDPMTTTTAQATVLTEEQLANIESTLDTYVQHHRKVDTEWARTMAMNVVRSHRALTEQVRVLEQRRGCRRPATGYTDLATPDGSPIPPWLRWRGVGSE